MTEAYVVDTSALMQAYIEDEFTPHMEHLLTGLGEDNSLEIHMMDVALAEIGNVLWKRVYLLKKLEAEIAKRLLRNVLELPLTIHDTNPHLQTALALGLDHGLAIYDTLVIALAQQLNLPLITADQKQSHIARKAGVAVKALSDFQPSE